MPQSRTARIPFRWVYGPVPSRRLGLSLGIDLVPFKTCTYDCVYCQLGRTTKKTVVRKDHAPVQEILAEIERKLAGGLSPDYIALGGSGEPTLHAGIGALIRGLKRITAVPMAVLTNGALLWDRDLQGDLLDADLVLPSLDAGDERTFRRVNRPHAAIHFDRMTEGLMSFTARFRGPVWLEIFLLDGVTGIPGEVEKIAALARRIRPARIQLNTVSRPPAALSAHPVPRARMRRFAAGFAGPVDVLEGSGREGAGAVAATKTTDGELLALLRRRPCTLRGVAFGLRIHPAEAAKRLSGLVEAGVLIRRGSDGGETHYSPAECAAAGGTGERPRRTARGRRRSP